MRKFILLVVVGLAFIDTPSKSHNRKVVRYNSAQMEEAIYTINHLSSLIVR